MSFLKTMLVIAFIIIYVTLSHVALAVHDAHRIWRQIAMLMLLVPMSSIACWGAVTLLKQLGVNKLLRLSCGIAMAFSLAYAVLIFWPVLLARLDLIYLTEHIATNSMLCWFFAHTLFAGRTPIITTLARTIHAEMPDNVERYTRNVTVAWALFFAVQIALSLLIFIFGSIEVWSLFANVLNWPLVILMFAVEYACRKRVNRDFPHATIKESIDAYFNNSRKA
ncbi:hypothetical protein [Herminiimonas aquatilis]|uniref:Uncharacterized protein n=1 Tax=Herminiimonas aquatilis TaxID=345342 RepID=A0ABW2J5A5_9BURK